MDQGEEGRKETDEFGGRGDFSFFPPLFRVRLVTTWVRMRVVNQGHESRMSTACTFSFYRLVHQFMGNRAWHCSSVLAGRDPRGGGGGLHSTLGSLGPSNCSGKPSKAPPHKSFLKNHSILLLHAKLVTVKREREVIEETICKAEPNRIELNQTKSNRP